MIATSAPGAMHWPISLQGTPDASRTTAAGFGCMAALDAEKFLAAQEDGGRQSRSDGGRAMSAVDIYTDGACSGNF